MTDQSNTTSSTSDASGTRLSGQSWPGPLGDPGLTSEQRQRLAEDRVLAAAARLDPDDHRQEANVVREAAVDIRDHRAAAIARAVAEFARRTAEREAALAKFRADPEDLGRLTDVELVRAREITLDGGEYRQLTTEIDRRLNRTGGTDHPAARSAQLGPAQVRVLVPRSIVDSGRRAWRRLADLPLSARVGYLIDQVWQHGYQHGYRTAHTAMTHQVAHAATEAAASNPSAWHSLHHLSVAAAEAAVRATTRPTPAGLADQRTVITGQIAAGRASEGAPEQEPPWRQVVDIAWTGSVSAGAIAGQLAAATDVLAGWRARGGHQLADTAAVDGRPVRGWVADLLAGFNQSVANQISPTSTRTQAVGPVNDGSGPDKAGPVRLARQDRASGVPARAIAPERVQPPPTPSHPTPAPQRRSR